jgi:hypothetical protein
LAHLKQGCDIVKNSGKKIPGNLEKFYEMHFFVNFFTSWSQNAAFWVRNRAKFNGESNELTYISLVNQVSKNRTVFIPGKMHASLITSWNWEMKSLLAMLSSKELQNRFIWFAVKFYPYQNPEGGIQIIFGQENIEKIHFLEFLAKWQPYFWGLL